ncbi:MAG: DUF5689 domain-containing protein [Bacteroidota bacterium]
MKKEMRLYKTCLLLVLVTGFRCNKKFDEPPAYVGPDIQANLSIRDLRAMHFTGAAEKIDMDYVIEGIVTANDKEDNLYKTIVLEDSTAGISIRLEGFGLYNDYPVGRKLAVKLKELWLGDYARMIQLGGTVDRTDPSVPQLVPLPAPLFERHLVKKSLNNPVTAKQVRIDELHDSLQSRLIVLDNVEFSVSDTGTTYADAINKLSDNKIIKSCNGNSAYIRTSGFAGFAAAKTPRGNGRITAIYSVFRTDKQLLLRDTSDVQLNGLRCTGSGTKLLLYEDFEGTVQHTPFSRNGWKNLTETGSVYFMAKNSLGNSYAEISAFATMQPTIISWLISPAINVNNSANEVLSFFTKDGFDNGGVLQVFASTNYDGGNTPSKAKWVLLKSIVSKGSVSSIASGWVASGNISLSGFQGMVYIAFRYDAADPATVHDKRTTTFQLDNVKIEGN